MVRRWASAEKETEVIFSLYFVSGSGQVVELVVLTEICWLGSQVSVRQVMCRMKVFNLLVMHVSYLVAGLSCCDKHLLALVAHSRAEFDCHEQLGGIAGGAGGVQGGDSGGVHGQAFYLIWNCS